MLKDRTIYKSLGFLPKGGLPILADFGEARLGDEEHSDDIMPDIYRAPEVMLRSKWGYKVDIWSVAMAVSGNITNFAQRGNANVVIFRPGTSLALAPLSVAKIQMAYLMTEFIWRNWLPC